MKQSKSVLFIKYYIIIRLILAILLFSIFFIFLFVKFDSGFLAGFQNGMIKEAVGVDKDAYDSLHFGRLTGSLLLFPTIFSILMYIFFKKKIYYGLLVTTLINLIFGLSQFNFGIIFTVIFLILLVKNKNIKKYFEKETTEKNENEIIDNFSNN